MAAHHVREAFNFQPLWDVRAGTRNIHHRFRRGRAGVRVHQRDAATTNHASNNKAELRVFIHDVKSFTETVCEMSANTFQQGDNGASAHTTRRALTRRSYQFTTTHLRRETSPRAHGS